MDIFGVTIVLALLVSAIGFKKYVWFISVGYGFSISAIGIFLLFFFLWKTGPGSAPLFLTACALLILYGFRLSGYLVYREMRSGSYNRKMQKEIKPGSDISLGIKFAIWITVAALYACETAPITFRLVNGLRRIGTSAGTGNTASPRSTSDLAGAVSGPGNFGIASEIGSSRLLLIGVITMAAGLILETAADLEKNRAKKARPGRFVDTGLYRIVRCPNYLGEVLFWTGVFVTGISSNTGALEWTFSLAGYLGIVYVMFGGARRLELRQNRTYGDDPDYRKYVKKTPILIPFLPLYSVAKYKWLLG